MNSILLVRTSAIGDVIQTFPVIEYLRARFPRAKINWVVEKGIAPLLMQLRGAGCDAPLIDHVIAIDTKQWSKSFTAWRQSLKTLRACTYDVVFDLQGNTKSGLITAMARAKKKVGYGWNSVREKPNLLATSERFDFPLHLNVREKYLRLVQAHEKDDQPFISQGIAFALLPPEIARLEEILRHPVMQHPFKLMIAVGSKWNNKKIQEETLVSLLQEVQSTTETALILIYGNSEEKMSAERMASRLSGPVSIVGELTLPLWQTLMRHTNGIVAVDSAALHFAGTTQTPSFSFFGPTSATIFKPIEKQHDTYQGTCPYGKTFHKQCPILRTCPTGACIKGLTLEQIRKPFRSWIDQVMNGR